jgi:hypothetical protein
MNKQNAGAANLMAAWLIVNNQKEQNKKHKYFLCFRDTKLMA